MAPACARAELVHLRAPAALAHGPLERIQIICHLEVNRIWGFAHLEQPDRVRRRDLVDVGEDDEWGLRAGAHARAKEVIHVVALRDLVDEGRLAGRELLAAEDGVHGLVRERSEAVRVRGKCGALRAAGERAVGLDDEELRDDGVELVHAYLEQVELRAEEDGVPDIRDGCARIPAVQRAELSVNGDTFCIVVRDYFLWTEWLVPERAGGI